jgi:2-polyprenyl-3-methyl-5-hydroxy-6-metoxy-1,4-benzoquinol methylase
MARVGGATGKLGAAAGPRTQALISAVLARWPDHEKFLRASFHDRSPELLRTTEAIVQLLERVAVDRGRSLSAFVDDYRYLCEEIVFPEELFFRREGRYRLATFAEANEQVYNNPALMARYMDGLFVSDALWLNHASAMNDFATVYLTSLPAGGRHLEIGPGHGMLLHLAMRYGRFASLAAWDVSETSIAHTRHVLGLMGEADQVDLRLQNLYDSKLVSEFAGRFDTIVFSEVLEHLEEPLEALRIIRRLLSPSGTVWVNVPANGPAPDHLYLLRSPEEARAVVEAAGLTLVRTAAFPVAGASLDRAIRQELPISCVLVGANAN